MIKLTEQNTANAIVKSRKVKPFVKYVAERIFDVQSSQNNQTYQVELFLINGEKFGQCNCKASERNLVCFHITSAISVNFYRQNLKLDKQTKTYSIAEMNNSLNVALMGKQPIERRGGTKI
jgi:hypothetical protein